METCIGRKAYSWRSLGKFLVLAVSSMLVASLLANRASAAETAQPSQETHSPQGTSTMTTHIPQPKLRTRIDMGSIYVWRLTFSPDSRYLAVGDAGSSAIVIRDLKLNREQARIDVKQHFGGPTHLHWMPGEEIVWSPDGRFVTNGKSFSGPETQMPISFWEPMTGAVSHEAHILAWQSFFNRDGSKLVTLGGARSKVVVHDTHTWQVKELDSGLVTTEGVGWTADDKIIAVGVWVDEPFPGRPTLHLQDGHVPPGGSIVAELIDPMGKIAPRAVVLGDPIPMANILNPARQFRASLSCQGLVTSYSGNKVAIRCTDGKGFLIHMLDARTLQILFIHHDPDALVGNGDHGIAFSPDGKYLYLLAHEPKDRNVNSLILDAETGKQVGTFPAGNSEGLAVSSDGKTMAAGHEHEIQLFDLQ
jgi:WD40 repeat protein